MFYSPGSDLGFVHIHKTGGISFRRFLRRNIADMQMMPELPHAHHSVAELFAALSARGQDPTNTRVLSIIRNPFAHVVSIYFYWRSNWVPRADKKLPHVRDARKLSFKEFVARYVVDDPYIPMLLVDGELPKNVFILQLETLKEDSERVLNGQLKLGLPIEIEHMNASKHRPFMRYYDEETEAAVRNVYKWCFDQGFYR